MKILGIEIRKAKSNQIGESRIIESADKAESLAELLDYIVHHKNARYEIHEGPRVKLFLEDGSVIVGRGESLHLAIVDLQSKVGLNS